MFCGFFKKKNPEAVVVKAEPVDTTKVVEIDDAVPWDVTGIDEGIKYVQKFGFACEFVRNSFQHVPAPFSVCGVLFTVLLQEIETATSGQQAFKALCDEVRLFQQESLDPDLGFYVKIVKLQKLCLTYSGSSKKAESDVRRLYEILENECKNLNGTIKDLLEDCVKHRGSPYHSLGGKADASRTKLLAYKAKLQQTLKATHFVLDVNAKQDVEDRLNNQARSSIKFKAFKDKWQAGWDSEVETDEFLRWMDSVLDGGGKADPRSVAAFKSMVALKCVKVVTCKDINELTAHVKLTRDEDADDLLLEDVIEKMVELSLNQYERLNSFAMQELWRSNKFGESVSVRAFGTALSVALKKIGFNDGDADVGELGEFIKRSKGAELTIINLNSLCKGISPTLPLSEVFFRMYFKHVEAPPTCGMEVFNRSSEKLTFIWTAREVSADDGEVADATIWAVEPGKKRFTALDSASFLTVLCENIEAPQTCRVIAAGEPVVPGARLFFDDKSITDCTNKPIAFHQRFFPAGASHPKGVEQATEKTKKGAKKCISVDNASAFALIAMWTTEMIPRGTEYVENVQYDLLPNSCVTFDQFESDMFLTLVRLKSDSKNYALVMFSKKVERGHALKLTFDIVCDEKLKLEPADTFFLRFARPTGQAPSSLLISRALFPETGVKVPPPSSPLPLPTPPLAAEETPYRCPKCNVGYRYTAAGERGTPKKNGDPRATMVNCKCWGSEPSTPTSAATQETPYCCPKCSVGYKYTAAGERGTPKKNGDPRATMVNCKCWGEGNK